MPGGRIIVSAPKPQLLAGVWVVLLGVCAYGTLL